MRGGSGRQSFELKDFSGGQVSKAPPKNIDPKYSPDCFNVYSEGAVVRRRDGIAVVNSTAASGAGNGLYNWVRGSATTNQWLVGMWGASLFKMDITAGVWDGTWDAISVHSASGTAFTTAGGIAYFANFNGVLIISNEGRERVQKMTTSDTSYFNIEVGGTGTAPLAQFVFNWKNHAWFLNCSGSEDQVVHSSVNSYNNFTGSTYGANNLLTENDLGITSGFILNGRLYAMKAFSIHRFTYTGSPSPLVEIRTIKSVVGTKSPRTVRNVSTPEGEVILFLGSNKKLYLCDGQETQEISDAIDIATNSVASVYMQAINEKILNKCFAVVHEDLNWYELFFGVGTGTNDQPTHSIAYDYRVKSFWPMTNRNFTYGNISDNGSGKRVVYTQGTIGKAYLLNSTNSDDGVAIDYRYTTGKMGKSILLSRIDEVEVETDIVSCRPTFAWRADWETNWISQTMSSGTNSHNWSPGRIDNMIQFRISGSDTSAPFKLWSIIGSERAIGVGK